MAKDRFKQAKFEKVADRYGVRALVPLRAENRVPSYVTPAQKKVLHNLGFYDFLGLKRYEAARLIEACKRRDWAGSKELAKQYAVRWANSRSKEAPLSFKTVLVLERYGFSTDVTQKEATQIISALERADWDPRAAKLEKFEHLRVSVILGGWKAPKTEVEWASSSSSLMDDEDF